MQSLPQSALDPAGAGAELVATLFWWMLAGAGVIWASVIGIALYAARKRVEHGERPARLFIAIGGVTVPVIVIAALLAYALSLMPGLLAPGAGLRVAVVGEQWWWRVRYLPPDGRPPVDSANEIQLPAGERVSFELSSPDVIHSFWIPSLGGKMDMIPGRITELVLEPLRPGIYRGACAEYCGASHTLMAFAVEVMEPREFDRWLAAQAEPAASPETELARRGARLFLDNGCGACHRIAGTPANGLVGPDLTHIGSRRTIAAGTLPMNVDAMTRWIGHTRAVKPAVLMPTYDMLSEEDRRAIAVYLVGLE